MRVAACLLALTCLGSPAAAENGGSGSAPTYSSASIVNSATNASGPLAPNTIASLYGQNLSWTTRAVSADDVRQGSLPTMLAGTGVWVLINNVPAPLYFVSPTQINLLIPGNLLPGDAWLQIVRDGRAGPKVRLRLREAAPALYLLDESTAIAVRPDGSVATVNNPARPGEIVVLYGTGFGPTRPGFPPGALAPFAAELEKRDEFGLWLDGVPVAPEDLLYVGVTPGFAGLYQINLRLPAHVGPRPEIRIAAAGIPSPAGVYLPVRP